MLTAQTMEKMISMKMFKMAEAFKEREGRADHRDLSHAEFLGLLIDDEYQERQNKKMSSRLRGAKFKETAACIENISYSKDREVKKKDILELAQNDWIKRHQNIIFTGPTGAGKSYLAQALGNNACKAGYSVMYMRMTKLLQSLMVAKADGTYIKHLRQLARVDVLIIDDFGLTAIEEHQKQDLFEVIEDRHQVRSTVLTAQLPTAHWHDYLGGGMLGDSICDRLLHNCHKLTLHTEESLRKQLKG